VGVISQLAKLFVEVVDQEGDMPPGAGVFRPRTGIGRHGRLLLGRKKLKIDVARSNHDDLVGTGFVDPLPLKAEVLGIPLLYEQWIIA
jgi:hypothetical protein